MKDVQLFAFDPWNSLVPVRVNPEGDILAALDVSDITVDTDLDSLNGTTIATNSGVSNAGTLRVVHAVDVVSSTDARQMGGTDIAVNSGVVGAGVQRVVLVTDVSASTDTRQLGGNDIALNSGVASAGTQRFVHVTDVAMSTVTVPDATAGTALSNDDSTAYEKTTVSKASAGRLYMLTGFNSSTSAQYIQVHNAVSQPDEAAVPVITIYVPGTSNFSYDAGVYGKYFSTGIVVLNSSTAATKTHEATAADCWFNIQYI